MMSLPFAKYAVVAGYYGHTSMKNQVCYITVVPNTICIHTTGLELDQVASIVTSDYKSTCLASSIPLTIDWEAECLELS